MTRLEEPINEPAIIDSDRLPPFGFQLCWPVDLRHLRLVLTSARQGHLRCPATQRQRLRDCSQEESLVM